MARLGAPASRHDHECWMSGWLNWLGCRPTAVTERTTNRQPSCGIGGAGIAVYLLASSSTRPQKTGVVALPGTPAWVYLPGTSAWVYRAVDACLGLPCSQCCRRRLPAEDQSRRGVLGTSVSAHRSVHLLGKFCRTSSCSRRFNCTIKNKD